MFRFKRSISDQIAEVVDSRGRIHTVPLLGQGRPPEPGQIVNPVIDQCCRPSSVSRVPESSSDMFPEYPEPRRISTEESVTTRSIFYTSAFPPVPENFDSKLVTPFHFRQSVAIGLLHPQGGPVSDNFLGVGRVTIIRPSGIYVLCGVNDISGMFYSTYTLGADGVNFTKSWHIRATTVQVYAGYLYSSGEVERLYYSNPEELRGIWDRFKLPIFTYPVRYVWFLRYSPDIYTKSTITERLVNNDFRSDTLRNIRNSGIVPNLKVALYTTPFVSINGRLDPSWASVEDDLARWWTSPKSPENYKDDIL